MHEDFDHVLHTRTDGPFTENCAKTFKDGCVCLGRVFCKKSTDFTSKPNGDFDGVIGWTFEKQNKDLECDDLVCDGLVDEVCNEGGGRVTDNLTDILNACQ